MRCPEDSWTYKSGVHGDVVIGDINLGAVMILTMFRVMKLNEGTKGWSAGNKEGDL